MRSGGNPSFGTICDCGNAGLRGASVQVWGHDTRYMTRGKGFAVISPVTGEIANTDYLPGREGTWTGVVATFFALHFATFGGDVVRVCYFLLGVAGAFLFYSGNLLWISQSQSRCSAAAADRQ